MFLEKKIMFEFFQKLNSGAFHNEFFLSRYFFGYDFMVPSADANTEAYFAHLKKLGAWF